MTTEPTQLPDDEAIEQYTAAINSDFDDAARFAKAVWFCFVFAFLLVVGLWCATTAYGAEYVRQGGTADFACCADPNCATVIPPQYAREWAAKDACSKLTDADGVQRYVRQWPMRVTKSGGSPSTPPPPPPPAVTGTASLSWTPPTQNTDRSPLTNLAGYRILYGTAPGSLTRTIQVPNAALSTYIVESLASGTWYFAMTTYTSAGAESELSNVATKVVP